MFTILDRYIAKRLLDHLFLGIVVFTLVLFFSDALLDFMRHLQHYGIAWDISLTLVGLQVPRIVAMVIPMSALLSTLLVYNTLNNQFELISMRMSGISLLRLSMPAITIGVLAALATFLLDNYVVPTCFKYTRALRNYAISEMNLPAVQENFMYKQFDDRQQLKRLLYVSSFDGNKLGYSTLIDLTNPLTLQVTQARAGYWGNQSIELKNANVYTVSSNQKLSNTTQADYLELQHFIRPQNVSLKGFRPAELSFFKFWGWLENRVAQGKKVPTKYYVEMWEKLTIPLTSLPLVLIAVPLSLTSPRKLNNIGFPAAIVILFLYYVLRHLSVQMGEIGLVTPLLAATLPLIVLGVTSALLYQRKSRVL